jgi:hypothetical protein
LELEKAIEINLEQAQAYGFDTNKEFVMKGLRVPDVGCSREACASEKRSRDRFRMLSIAKPHPKNDR